MDLETTIIPCRHINRYVRKASGALALVALAFLAGCGDDQYKLAPTENKELVTAPPIASLGPDVVPPPAIDVPALPANDLRDDLGISTERYSGYSSRDLVDKADIFWKLYYMNKSLETGHIEPEVRSALDKVARTTGKMTADNNVASIQAIIKDLKTGFEADALTNKLSSQGVGMASVNWSGGQLTVSTQLQNELNKKRSLSGRASSVGVRDAAEWAGHHHASPEQIRRESFARASAATLALGDDLDDERKQAGEHLIGREKVLGAGLGNSYESSFPTNPVR